MSRTLFAIAFALFSGTLTQAGEIELSKPIQGASLHDGGIDMVVYYTDHSTHFEVVATYVENDHPDHPSRLRMRMQDGDDVTFSLSGLTETRYAFARNGEIVRVTSITDPRYAEAQ